MKDLKELLAQLEEGKNKISAERDKIREIFLEIEGLLEKLDSGIEDIHYGIRDIQSGIDTISEEL